MRWNHGSTTSARVDRRVTCGNPTSRSRHTRSGARRHVRREDVVRVAIEVLASTSYRMVVRGSAGRAAIWTSGRSTPASSMVVTKVCRSMCGCIRGNRTPASAATCRSRRVAACRSMRTPRPFSSSGPIDRSPAARSTARLTAGGSGTRTTLPPLPRTRRTRWPCSSPRSSMSAPTASKIRKPSSPSRHTSAKSNGLLDCLAAVSIASNWRCVSPSVGDSGGRSVAGRSRPASAQDAVDDAGPVEARDDRQPAGDGGRLERPYVLQPPQVKPR